MPRPSSSAPRLINPTSQLGILGGGLAGLTSAYYLAKHLPASTRIVVWEKEDRLGGWVQSSRIKDRHSPSGFVVESGPRSVRPKGLAGLISLELIKDLELMDKVIVVPKDHPSAQNRYIFTHHGLQKLPSSMTSLLKSIHRRPVSLMPRAILKDVVTRAPDKSVDEDESIQEFIARRFGAEIGEELISGMVHGIYAGDYRELSVRSSIFNPVWELERKFGGVLNGLRLARKLKTPSDSLEEEKRRQLLKDLPQGLVDSSVWGLKGGLQSLIDGLRNWLEKKPNVLLKSAESVQFITLSPGGPSKVTTSRQVYDQLDHLVSALPPRVLHSCLEPALQARLDVLRTNPSVTVGVVNLAYRSTGRINPIPAAFGYLIPASIGPDINPHNVLGVVFDSDMMPAEEDVGEGQELTKLTVMLGGHHYSKHPGAVPSLDLLAQQAAQAIQTQLGIPQDPFFLHAQLQKDCIPQYLVGHRHRMARLRARIHGLNVSLVGSGYSGVGINDVVRSAKENADNLITCRHSTGLESFEN